MVDYIDKKGEKRKMYRLTRDGVMQLGARYDAKIRYALIQKMKELEEKIQYGKSLPRNFPEALRALAEAEEERLALTAKIESDKPKVLFADAVDMSDSSILIGDMAKILRQNGVSVGQNRLFAILREQGYLMSSGLSYNLPSQRSMNSGWLRIMERTIQDPKGKPKIVKTTMVTGKGQQYFVNKFLKENNNASASYIATVH